MKANTTLKYEYGNKECEYVFSFKNRPFAVMVFANTNILIY